MERSFKIWFGSLLVTVAFVWVSFHWFDKPIAMGIYNLFRRTAHINGAA